MPKLFKTNEFQNGMFLKPSWVTINTEVIIFNNRLSTITKFNHEIQEQWHFAPMLNSSMSSLLGAFDFSASVKGIYVKSSSYLDFEEIFVVAAITKVIYEANAAKERSWPEFSNVQSSRAVLAPSSSPGLFWRHKWENEALGTRLVFAKVSVSPGHYSQVTK